MELDTLLQSRRSVRRFDAQKPVDEQSLRQMIAAAVLAPSWKNSQTARYTVITEQALLHRVRQEALPPFNAANCEGATALIVTGFVKSRSGFDRAQTPENELGECWGAYDLGLQNQNLILKAKELGFDTLIMGIRDAQRLRELLNIDPQVMIAAVIAVGVRAAEPTAPARKTVDEIARFL